MSGRSGSSPISERTVEIDGIRTRVLATEGRGPTYLLVHGFADSADTWRRVMRRLGQAGCRAIAVDLPSHGRADALTQDRGVIEQLVAFTAAAAEHFGNGEPVIAVGNSLGGTTVLLLAERHPQLVHGVVPIGPAAFDHPAWFAALGRDRVLTTARSVAKRRLRLPIPAVVAATAAGAVIRTVGFGQPWRAPRAWVAGMTELLTAERRRDLVRLALRLPDEVLGAPEGVYDLASLRTPVLLLWGDRDRLALPSSADRLVEMVPGLKHVPLLGIGHLPQVEAPGRTTKHLLEFADAVVPGRLSSVARHG